MAVCGAVEGLDPEKRQRLQEYEDLVDQDYDPFHEKCGKNVLFSNKKLIATRRSDEWANGVAFSAKPIPLGRIFRVKLLEISESDGVRPAILGIGFTLQDPNTMDPDVITKSDLRENKYYWLFWGSTVCHGGKKWELPCGILPSSFVKGDTIGCCITRDGDLEIHINGQKRAVGWRNVPVDKPLWGVVEIYCNARTIQSEFYCNDSDEPPLPPLVEQLLDDSEALLDKLYPSRECEDSTPEAPEVEDSGPDEAYCMSTYPRGPAIIINNATFQAGSGLDDRPGTEKDGKALQHLFTSSGFVTKTFNDLTAGGMQQVLQSYAKRNYIKAQCLIVAILTHGGEGGSLYGVDGCSIKVETLTEFFAGRHCCSLVGKPKVFFIQACRGEKWDSAVKGIEETDSLQQTNETADGLKEGILPSQSDFLLSFSTVEGYVSHRDTEYGSWYVRDLVEVFTKNAAEVHLLDMLTMVNNKVSKRSASKDRSKQTSSVRTELRKKLYIKPGEYDHRNREPNRCCITVMTLVWCLLFVIMLWHTYY